MSNRDRIARAAEEARITASEKAAKKAAKEPASARAPRAPKPPARVKLVWEICTANGKSVKVFAYPDKAAAEAELAKLSAASGTYLLRATKVPME